MEDPNLVSRVSIQPGCVDGTENCFECDTSASLHFRVSIRVPSTVGDYTLVKVEGLFSALNSLAVIETLQTRQKTSSKSILVICATYQMTNTTKYDTM